MSFRLPDFLAWAPLNALRQKMGAPLTDNFVLERVFSEISIIEQLNTGGVDVELDEISVHDDGTLLYHGYRGLLYIRDIASYSGEDRMPKYHMAFCRTLDTKKRENRLDRYVVAQTTTGEFKVNLIDNEVTSKMVRLSVCQNCLDRIGWKGFSLRGMSQAERHLIVVNFSLADFFAVYPRDLIGEKPRHTATTAPLNNYVSNWSNIARQTKLMRGLRCESCDQSFSPERARFLHVHHRNGLKNDNRESNLAVLCIRCHAEQPEHGHLKASPDYKTFINLR